MPQGEEQVMAHSTNITAVLRALENTIQNERQRSGSLFGVGAVLDDVAAFLANAACKWRGDEEHDADITAIPSIVTDVPAVDTIFLPSNTEPDSMASDTSLEAPPSCSAEGALATGLPSPFCRPFHGRLPDDLYLQILRLVGDGVGDVNLRNCRLVDRFAQMLIDSEAAFWRPVVLHGVTSAANAGFFVDRAGQAPIDVSIRLSADDHYAANGPLAQVAARMRRIGSLSITADRPIPGPAFADLLAAKAPFLHSLTVDGLIAGDIPATRRIAEHPKLRRLRVTISCLRALQSVSFVALRCGITHLDVTAGGGKATLNEVCGFFPGLDSVSVVASCLEDSFNKIMNLPPELELIDDSPSAQVQRPAGATACLLMRTLRRLIVRRADADTIDLVQSQYQVLNRLAITPTQLAFWLGFERARIFPDVHPDVIVAFVARMRVHALSSLILSRFIPKEALRHISKGDFRRLRVLTVYVGPMGDGRLEDGVDDVLQCRKTWRFTRLRKLRIVARMDDEAVASGIGIPTVRAADVIRFVQDTLRYAPLRELWFEGVQLAEGMDGPQDRNVRKLARRVHFE